MDILLQILQAISFLFHGILKNLAIGGIPILMMMRYRSANGDAQAYYRTLAQDMGRLMPMVLGLAVVFGLMNWAVVRWQYEWTLLPIWGSSLISWLGLLLLLVIGFGGMVWLRRAHAETPGLQWMIACLVIICMILIAGLFVSSHINMPMLSNSAGNDERLVESAALLSTFWPRLLHTVCSGLAITGVALAIYGSLRPQSREDHQKDPAPYDIRLVRFGVGWALAGTVPQVVVGPWFMLALPAQVRVHLIEGTSVVSLIFFLSLTLTLLSLVLLNSSLMIPQKRGLVWGGVGSLILTTVLMVLIREEVRNVWLLSLGERIHAAPLSWPVVIVVLGIAGAGLYLGCRCVTLSHKAVATR
ncbi:MAG: hypothetical protein MRJ96_00295 [Nitrospirales bacterium]|nr:hypothetical protein [Nitrospira sp.]MDR4499879.1 hypothetical protein [Nitrospirales bacterium]